MIRVENACVAYGTQAVLRDVSLHVRPGEIVSLAGANGSGKSTLARLLCGMRLADTGSAVVDGRDARAGEAERRVVRQLVGIVQQDPRDQIVSTLVSEEVAFGPRNLGLAEDEVRSRVAAALSMAGLEGYEERDSTGLSGGEQQRLALAGVLAMRPRYLVLDEATSQLDSAVRPAFRALFRRLAREEGLGVVQVTHDALELLSGDRVVALSNGAVAWEGTPARLLDDAAAAQACCLAEDSYLAALRCAMGQGYDLSRGVEPEDVASWLSTASHASETVSAVRTCLFGGDFGDTAARAVPAPESSAGDEAVADPSNPDAPRASLVMEGVSFSYGAERAVADISLRLGAGHVTLIAGLSGSGKSTVAMLAAGLLAPDAGTVAINKVPVEPGAAGLAFQHPESQFFLDTVRDELAFAPRNLGCGEEEAARRVARAAACVGLDETLLERYPFDLSGGQARRVALASVITLDASAYLLDEPSAGLDARARGFVHRLAQDLASAGAAVAVISHDLAEWMDVADDALLVRHGRIVWRGRARALRRDARPFERAGLLPPEGMRLASLLDGAGAQR